MISDHMYHTCGIMIIPITTRALLEALFKQLSAVRRSAGFVESLCTLAYVAKVARDI